MKRFAANQHDAHGDKLKVPHMGWNTVHQTQAHPLFEGIAQDTRFYFVHSYYFARPRPKLCWAAANIAREFACVVGKDNVFATQFHTKKSHDGGLLLLRNFLRWNG